MGHKWRNGVICALLVTGTVVGVAWAAVTQGSQDDPLVTLSYLDQVALPQVMEQVDQKLIQREDELAEKLRQASGAEDGSFAAVEVSAGTTLTLSGGTQVLLRAGTATSQSPLIDLTTGENLYGELAANHLYLATADGQTVTVSQAGTLLVLGDYQ